MNVKLAPILLELAEAQKSLDEGQKVLDNLNREKDECEAKVAALQADAAETQKKKEDTEFIVEENKKKLVRAKKLLDGLADEKSRWEEEVKMLKFQSGYLTGNCIIAAGMMSYGGPFDSVYRQRLTKIWIKKVRENHIPMTDDVSLIGIAGKKVVIEGWKGLYGLPDDDLSIENAIILENTQRRPLFIDPQGQANMFIKKMGNDMKKPGFFEVLKATDDKISKVLETSIKLGKWVLVEGVSEKLSPELEPVLSPQITKKQKQTLIKFGDKDIE